MQIIHQKMSDEFYRDAKFHSLIEGLLSNQSIPLFQMAVKPYEYYLKFNFEGTRQRLEFYSRLTKLSSIIVIPEYVTVTESRQSGFCSLLDMPETSHSSSSMFLKYHNFTLRQWIDLMHRQRTLIPQHELLYVFKSLLNLAQKYYKEYHQQTNLFLTRRIYVSLEKKLRIYPFHFNYRGQIAKVELGSSQEMEEGCISKNNSISTTLSHSQVDSLSRFSMDLHSFLSADLRDIFIILLEIISFKPREYFYSEKHQSIIWDAAKGILRSFAVNHLSKSFIRLMLDIVEGKLSDGAQIGERIDEMINLRGRECYSLSTAVNQKALKHQEMSSAAKQTERRGQLSARLSSSPHVQELRRSRKL